MTTILLLQGANMSYLGKRQPEIYGTTPAAELDRMMQRHAEQRGAKLEICYTHIEGEAIGRLYRAADENIDGLLMNPAGFTYAGYALRDCLRSMQFPYVEVHMSNIDKRGFKSVTAETARGVITGFGLRSYLMGFDALLGLIQDAKPAETGPAAKVRSALKGKTQ
jgi:3-dehydroquinate dehydratase II